eukprot:Rmarinus@m.11957
MDGATWNVWGFWRRKRKTKTSYVRSVRRLRLLASLRRRRRSLPARVLVSLLREVEVARVLAFGGAVVAAVVVAVVVEVVEVVVVVETVGGVVEEAAVVVGAALGGSHRFGSRGVPMHKVGADQAHPRAASGTAAAPVPVPVYGRAAAPQHLALAHHSSPPRARRVLADTAGPTRPLAPSLPGRTRVTPPLVGPAAAQGPAGEAPG